MNRFVEHETTASNQRHAVNDSRCPQLNEFFIANYGLSRRLHRSRAARIRYAAVGWLPPDGDSPRPGLLRVNYGRMEHSVWVARYLRRLRDMCLETDGAWALEHLETWMTDNTMLSRLEQDFEDPIKAAESVIYMELEVTKMTGEWHRLKTAS